MATIIERPSGDGNGGMLVIAAIVGALAVAVIGMFALGGFDRTTAPTTTSVTVEQPAAPATAPEAAPAPAEPAPAPDATETEPTEPTAPPAPQQ